MNLFSKIVFIGFLGINISIASDTDDLLGALGDGSWAGKYETSPEPISAPSSSSTASDNSSDMSTTSARPEVSCTRSKQTSLPQRVVRSLLSKRKFDVYHDPNTGKLSLDGGTMIGNCNSMLQYNFSQPRKGRPYVFQVEIRKPATGCTTDEASGKTLCKYEANTATDGITDDNKKTVKVEPNYYGFIQCLRKTGVMNGNAIIPSKISPTKFSFEKAGVHQTAKVLYYCHGPECDKPKMRLEATSQHQGNSCQYFENIKKGGFLVKSLVDVNKENKEALFNSICRSGNYELIEQHLPSFSEFKFMQDILVSVRNEIIKDEVKKLHKRLGAKNYAKLNATKFQKVINDFYSKVIVPKREAMIKQIRLVDSLPSGQKRKKQKQKLAAMAAELERLAKSPYLTSSDYKNMLSFIKKAPLKEQTWRDAALKLYKSQNTAYHFARYNPKLAKQYKLEDQSAEDTLVMIQQDVNSQSEKIDKIGVLANDVTGKVSYAADYKGRAENVLINHSNDLKGFQEEYMYERQYEAQNCYNSAAGMWGLVQQNCIMQSRQYQQDIISDYQYMNSPQYMQTAIYPQVGSYMGLSNEWSAIEAQRNQAYGIKPQPHGSRLGTDPRAYQDPRYSQMMQDQYSRMNPNSADAYYYQQQALQRQQNYSFNNMYRNPAGQQQFPQMQQQPYQPYQPYSPFQANAGMNWQFNSNFR